MLHNRELLDFDVDVATGKARVLDALPADESAFTSLGLGGRDRDAALTSLLRRRCLSPQRDDIVQILAAFGARSPLELAFMGHGVSLADGLWYRAPGPLVRWEDINCYDNDWDDAFCTAVLTHDYARLATCSPDVPDITTGGQLVKVWERRDGHTWLLKESLLPSGADLEGALLAFELCQMLLGEAACQPLRVVERMGRRMSASPLMHGPDEELVQGRRLCAMAGYSGSEDTDPIDPANPDQLAQVLTRAGIADASVLVAKVFTFKALALHQDLHEGNLGVIRNVLTGDCRIAPLFDFDRAFGFPSRDYPYEAVCKSPALATMLCCSNFSDLDPSWDWSWYDPRVLEGFEARVAAAFAGYDDLPQNFGELISGLFAMQRDYVNSVAGKE